MAPRGQQSAQQYVESPQERQIRLALEPASVSFANRMITDNVTGMPGAARPQDFSAVANRLYQTGYERMRPGFEAENDRMMTNLQARGIPVGSEAFNESYATQQRSVNDALTQLTSQATAAAGGEQSRQFGLDSAARANSLSELMALMGGGYNPPSGTPQGNASPVNYGGLVGQQHQSDVNRYNQQQQTASANMGALGSLGSAMLMKSDRRVKTDVVELGRRGPLTLYAYRYIWEDKGSVRLGYMAQEVAKILPNAVARIGAWLALDYAMLPQVEHA